MYVVYIPTYNFLFLSFIIHTYLPTYFQDGNLKSEYHHEIFRNLNISQPHLDLIYVGRGTELDVERSQFHRRTHPGQITDFNVWNQVLDIEKMIGWTNCRYLKLRKIIINSHNKCLCTNCTYINYNLTIFFSVSILMAMWLTGVIHHGLFSI